MQFRAINPARIPGAGRGPMEPLQDLARQSLRERLARLAELASWLSRCDDPASDEEQVRQYRLEFQQLLSPLAPRSVWRFHTGWYDALRRCLDEDQALLEPEGARSPREIRREERQRRARDLSWFPPFPARALETGRPLPVALLNRVASLKEVISHSGDGSRERALEVAFEQVVRAGMPPGTDLVAVDVEPGSEGPAPEPGAGWGGDVTGWRWSLDRHPGAGLVVRCRVALSEPERRYAIWVWTLFEEEGEESLTERIRGRSTRIEEVWEHLTGTRREAGGGLAADMAATLHQVASQAGGRPWSEVWGEIAPSPKNPEKHSPSLLRELLVHRSQVAALSRRDLSQLRRVFPRILALAPWSDIRRTLPVLDSVLPRGDRRQIQELWEAVTARLPADASLGDLRFVLWLGRNLSCDASLRLDLVDALTGLEARREPQAPLRALMARILADRSATLAPEIGAGLLEWSRAWWSGIPRAEMTGVSQAVIPVLRTLQGMGVTGDQLEDLLLGPRIPGLLRDMPRPAPGIWSTREQRGAFFEELACLAGLLPPRTGSRWDPAVLQWLHEPLPRILEHEEPCRFPSTYWPLLRCWLEGTVPDVSRVEAYQVEVVLSWIRALRQSPERGGGHSATPPIDQLERAARWMRAGLPWMLERAPSPYRDIVTEITTFPPGSPWHEVIVRALLGPGGGGKLGVAATALVGTGRLAGRTELVEWLSLSLAVPGDARLADLTHRVAREAARDASEEPERWIALLATLPAVDAPLMDPALDEIAIRVMHAGDPGPHGRILERVLRAMRSEPSILGGFRHWMERFRSLCAPDRETPALPLTEPVSLAILASSARPDSGPLVDIMERYWPAITSYLFWSCQEGARRELVAGFHGLMHRLPWVPAEAHVERVAGTLLRLAAAGPHDRRLLGALDLWTASLSGAAAPLPLVQRAWPGLPARLIVDGATREWKQLLEICRKLQVEGSDAMRAALACEVASEIASRAERGEPMAPDVAALGDILPAAAARAIWARFAALSRPDTTSPQDHAALMRDLHHILRNCPPERMNARIWSLGAALREIDEPFAARLVQELTR